MREIEYHRKLLKLTQRELADSVRVAQTKISEIERHGIVKVSYLTLTRIAEKLNFKEAPERLLDYVQIRSCN